MNISNISCEYFYDEEYDVPECIQESENNNIRPFLSKQNSKTNGESEFWAESVLETSGNNNCSESYIFDKVVSGVHKYLSSDNVVDDSIYSLGKNVPLLSQPSPEINYHLYFGLNDNVETSNKNCMHNFNLKKQLARRHGSKLFIDSGKGSTATSDSMFQPNKFCQHEVINSESNLHLSPVSDKSLQSNLKRMRKTRKQIWKRLKRAFSKKNNAWKETIQSGIEERCYRSYSMPNLSYTSDILDDTDKANRYSTTVLELYNLISDLQESHIDIFYPVFDEHQLKKYRTDFTCQFPEKIGPIRKLESTKSKESNFDYPGLGKVKIPSEFRTPITDLLRNKKMCEYLGFLSSADDSLNVRRSKSLNRHREGPRDAGQVKTKDGKKSVYVRSASECRQPGAVDLGLLRQCSRPTVPATSGLSVIEEQRSFSSADLRPIPRTWGLTGAGGQDEILALFQLGTSPIGGASGYKKKPGSSAGTTQQKADGPDRLGGLVSDCLSALRLLGQSLANPVAATAAATANSSGVALLVDRFIRFKDSSRQSTCGLLLAVDALQSLLLDGLSCGGGSSSVITGGGLVPSRRTSMSLATSSASSKHDRPDKLHQRLWLLVEESCRAPNKDVAQKMAFAGLVKQTKQLCASGGNGSQTAARREVTLQLRLHIFLSLALKAGLLHQWLRCLVANDAMLSRFYGTGAFLRQARTVLSNALSAVVMELRRLSDPRAAMATPPSSAGQSRGIVTRPAAGSITTRMSRPISREHTGISQSSSDNSLRSRIPRPNRK